MTKKTLAELNEIVLELEDNGLFREADVLHHEFVKMSQVSLGDTKTFKGMLETYAPTFLKLCRVHPKRVGGWTLNAYSSEPNYSNIKFVQELLLSSAYVKDKSGLEANGNFGPNTMRVMDDLRRLLNKILFDAYAAKFKVKDKTGNILTIEKSDTYF